MAEPGGRKGTTNNQAAGTRVRVVHRTHKKARGPRALLAQLRRPRVAAVCGLTAVLLIVVLLFACVAPPEGDSSALTSGSGSESVVEDPLPGIDLNADSLPDPETYVDTVLPETKDAGMSYVKETLFLGDSNTQRMLHYSDITGASLNNCIGVVGMGITSFESLNCVQFQGRSGMTNMVSAAKELQPRRIVITFGTNNLGMAVNNFIASYKKGLDALSKACPYTDIIIGAVFPVDRYCENQSITVDMVDKFNAALAALADSEGYKFLNWHEALRDTKTGHCQFEYTVIDGIHLSRDGMEAIFDYMRTHSYVTEDERPDRKDSPPKVAGVMPSVITQDPYKPEGPYSRSSSASSGSGSASSSSSSSSGPTTVTVVYSAYDQTGGTAGGGTVTVNGTTGASVSFTVAPGGAVGAAIPTPASGYIFVGWSCSTVDAGAIASGFTLPSTVAAGSTVSVTAIFQKTGTSSSGVSSGTTTTPSDTNTAPTDTTPTDTTPTDTTPTDTGPTTTTETPPTGEDGTEPDGDGT